MRWATRLALLMGGVPSRARAFVTWIAVLPIVVTLSGWMGSPALLTWIGAGAVGVVGVLFARRRDLPFTPEEKRLTARAVLTGDDTGDPDLDGYALRVLDTRKRIGEVPEKTALSVVTLSLLAGPILASITSSVWWLLMLPLEAAVVAGLAPYLALDTDENVRRIEAAIPPEMEPS
jgi:hypothetical protein